MYLSISIYLSFYRIYQELEYVSIHLYLSNSGCNHAQDMPGWVRAEVGVNEGGELQYVQLPASQC
jgi:hypothetical protein